MKDQMKNFFIKRLQQDNPHIVKNEAEKIFEKYYEYYKYMRWAEYDCLIKKWLWHRTDNSF